MLLLPCLVAAAKFGETQATDLPTLRLQEKAEDLYRNGHWQRAYFIYVNELAAVGDKYAQYMAGYMWLNGKGVPRDSIKASAWYRLAAERGSPEFVAVRDRLLESMRDTDLELSDAAYLSLRRTYSDVVLVFGHLRKERELLTSSPTGTRLSANTSPLRIVDPRSGVTISGDEYKRRLKAQMQLRLDFITRTLDIGDAEPDMGDREFEMLAARIDEYLQTIDDR